MPTFASDQMLGAVAGGGVAPIPLLFPVITALGLESTLVMSVDALDPDSYPGTGQIFYDLSGNGLHLNLGITSSAEGSDPTFDAAGYFSSDGGDAFDLAGANTAFMNALHLDGAQVSWFGEFKLPAGTPGAFYAFGTRIVDPGVIGLFANGLQKPEFVVRRSGGEPFRATADSAIAVDAWHHGGGSINENGGSVSFLWADGDYAQVGAADTFNAAYSSPGGTPGHFAVGGEGSNDTTTFGGFIPNGGLFSCFALWSSPLSKANLDAIRAAFGGAPRF